jgi:NhaA family Na+:H+ antiporter
VNAVQEKKESSRRTLPRLSRFIAEYLLVLPLGALIALVWANMSPGSYFRTTVPMAFVVNDIAMVAFFGMIAKEVVEATAPGGVLHSWRRVLMPVVASLGATAVAAVIYTTFEGRVDEPMLVSAWPVMFATDLAVSYLVARVIFHRHPAIPFLLLMGITANAAGIVMLVLVDPMGDLDPGIGVPLMAAALALVVALRRARVRSFWPYILGSGALSWSALYWGGLHPALALVPVLPFLPHAARDPGFFVDARPGARDALSRFEIWAKYPAQAALFFFALVNAGVPFGSLELGSVGVALAGVTGRPLGTLAAAGLAVAAGLYLPKSVGWRELTVVGLATAIGFSMGLFFAAGVLPTGQLLSETQMGVLLSLAGAPLAILAAKLLGVGRFARKPEGKEDLPDMTASAA